MAMCDKDKLNKQSSDSGPSFSFSQDSFFENDRSVKSRDLIEFLRKKRNLPQKDLNIFDRLEKSTERNSFGLEVQPVVENLELDETLKEMNDDVVEENGAKSSTDSIEIIEISSTDRSKNSSRTNKSEGIRLSRITSPSKVRVPRVSVKRLSQTLGKRVLLKEFEKTIVTEKMFQPNCVSTPICPDVPSTRDQLNIHDISVISNNNLTLQNPKKCKVKISPTEKEIVKKIKHLENAITESKIVSENEEIIHSNVGNSHCINNQSNSNNKNVQKISLLEKNVDISFELDKNNSDLEEINRQEENIIPQEMSISDATCSKTQNEPNASSPPKKRKINTRSSSTEIKNQSENIQNSSSLEIAENNVSILAENSLRVLQDNVRNESEETIPETQENNHNSFADIFPPQRFYSPLRHSNIPIRSPYNRMNNQKNNERTIHSQESDKQNQSGGASSNLPVITNRRTYVVQPSVSPPLSPGCHKMKLQNETSPKVVKRVFGNRIKKSPLAKVLQRRNLTSKIPQLSSKKKTKPVDNQMPRIVTVYSLSDNAVQLDKEIVKMNEKQLDDVTNAKQSINKNPESKVVVIIHSKETPNLNTSTVELSSSKVPPPPPEFSDSPRRQLNDSPRPQLSDSRIPQLIDSPRPQFSDSRISQLIDSPRPQHRDSPRPQLSDSPRSQHRDLPRPQFSDSPSRQQAHKSNQTMEISVNKSNKNLKNRNKTNTEQINMLTSDDEDNSQHLVITDDDDSHINQNGIEEIQTKNVNNSKQTAFESDNSSNEEPISLVKKYNTKKRSLNQSNLPKNYGAQALDLRKHRKSSIKANMQIEDHYNIQSIKKVSSEKEYFKKVEEIKSRRNNNNKTKNLMSTPKYTPPPPINTSKLNKKVTDFGHNKENEKTFEPPLIDIFRRASTGQPEFLNSFTLIRKENRTKSLNRQSRNIIEEEPWPSPPPRNENDFIELIESNPSSEISNANVIYPSNFQPIIRESIDYVAEQTEKPRYSKSKRLSKYYKFEVQNEKKKDNKLLGGESSKKKITQQKKRPSVAEALKLLNNSNENQENDDIAGEKKSDTDIPSKVDCQVQTDTPELKPYKLPLVRNDHNIRKRSRNPRYRKKNIEIKRCLSSSSSSPEPRSKVIKRLQDKLNRSKSLSSLESEIITESNVNAKNSAGSSSSLSTLQDFDDIQLHLNINTEEVFDNAAIGNSLWRKSFRSKKQLLLEDNTLSNNKTNNNHQRKRIKTQIDPLKESYLGLNQILSSINDSSTSLDQTSSSQRRKLYSKGSSGAEESPSKTPKNKRSSERVSKISEENIVGIEITNKRLSQQNNDDHIFKRPIGRPRKNKKLYISSEPKTLTSEINSLDSVKVTTPLRTRKLSNIEDPSTSNSRQIVTAIKNIVNSNEPRSGTDSLDTFNEKLTTPRRTSTKLSNTIEDDIKSLNSNTGALSDTTNHKKPNESEKLSKNLPKRFKEIINANLNNETCQINDADGTTTVRRSARKPAPRTTYWKRNAVILPQLPPKEYKELAKEYCKPTINNKTNKRNIKGSNNNKVSNKEKNENEKDINNTPIKIKKKYNKKPKEQQEKHTNHLIDSEELKNQTKKKNKSNKNSEKVIKNKETSEDIENFYVETERLDERNSGVDGKNKTVEKNPSNIKRNKKVIEESIERNDNELNNNKNNNNKESVEKNIQNIDDDLFSQHSNEENCIDSIVGSLKESFNQFETTVLAKTKIAENPKHIDVIVKTVDGIDKNKVKKKKLKNKLKLNPIPEVSNEVNEKTRSAISELSNGINNDERNLNVETNSRNDTESAKSKLVPNSDSGNSSESSSSNRSNDLFHWVKQLANVSNNVKKTDDRFTDILADSCFRMTHIDQVETTNHAGVEYSFYKSISTAYGFMKFNISSVKARTRSKKFNVHYLFLFGELEFLVNDEEYAATAGSFLSIPKDTYYSIKNKSEEIACLFFIKSN